MATNAVNGLCELTGRRSTCTDMETNGLVRALMEHGLANKQHMTLGCKLFHAIKRRK